MNNEWILAGAICAVPFLVFGAIELRVQMRRRRMAAIARRPKVVARGRSADNFGRAE